MAKNKTVETQKSIDEYVQGIEDGKRRADCLLIIREIEKLTGYPPKMWGTSIVGFGSYHYVYESGRTGDAPIVGLSSRANEIAFYLSANFENREELLSQLGKHKTGKGCVYVKNLADVDVEILLTMVTLHVKHILELYPGTN